MYCISYNLYKYIQRLSLLVFSEKEKKKKMKKKKGEWGFLLHRCKVKRGGFWIFRERALSEFFSCLFVMFVCGKNGFLYTNGAPYHVDQLGGQPQCGGGGLGRKCSLSPLFEEKKIFPPGGQCATVKSSLQSIHIAEVLFDFYKNKIQLRTKEPKACRSRTAARWRDSIA